MLGTTLSARSRQFLAFYVGTPLLIGLVIGLGQPGPPYFAVHGAEVVYAMVSTLLVWSLNGLCTSGGAMVLRPWQPRLTTVLLVGAIAGGIVWLPLRVVLNTAFAPLLAPGEAFGAGWPPADVWRWLRYCIGGSLTWLAANLIHFHGFGSGRFGYAPWRDPVLPSTADSGFGNALPENRTGAILPELPAGSRLPPELKELVLAAQALEHYCQLHTEDGTRLLRMPFTRLLTELADQQGMRVHRSWWVREQAVARLRRTAREWTLILECGREVPVSRTYRGFVEEKLVLRRSRNLL